MNTSAHQSTQDFIKAIYGDLDFTEPANRPSSPTSSSSSTLVSHHEERTIEMTEVSADSHWEEDASEDELEHEDEHFDEKDSEYFDDSDSEHFTDSDTEPCSDSDSDHEQTTTRTSQQDAETNHSFPSRSGKFPQHKVVQHAEEEEGGHPADMCSSFRKVCEIISCALLFAGSLAMAFILDSAVELSKDD